MVTRQGQPFIAGVGMAMIVGGLQALVLGAVSLRVTGLYFALVTLAYGTMAEESLFNIQSLTGGSAGQPAPKPMGFTTEPALLLPVPGLPGRRRLGRLAADEDQGRPGAAGRAGE